MTEATKTVGPTEPTSEKFDGLMRDLEARQIEDLVRHLTNMTASRDYWKQEAERVGLDNKRMVARLGGDGC